MNSTVQQIKDRLNIVEVVGSYLKLEKAGSSFKARCPFHNEKTPSFFVSPARESYYCFGCGAKGDIFNFVEQFEGIDFVGALKALADRAGVQIVWRRETGEAKSERERLYGALEAATQFFEAMLEKNPAVSKYLAGRGLEAGTIKEWRLGFAPDGWHNIEKHLLAEGFKLSELRKAGLVKNADSQSAVRVYDVFRNRIMFPIFDTAGRVVAFSGRSFGDEKDAAKYLNSPETELFKKLQILYGYHTAKNVVRKFNFWILVEGQVDLLMSQQAGFRNTVATSGTALTADHLRIMKRLSENLLIAYDADRAGFAAAERAFMLALGQGLNVKIAKIPEAKDPADFIAANPDGWKEVLKKAENVVSFVFDLLLAEKLPPEKFAGRFRQRIIPLLRAIPSDSERSRLVSSHKMAILTGIREDHIWEEIRRLPESVPAGQPDDRVPAEFTGAAANKIESLERRIFGIIFWQQSQKSPAVDLAEIRRGIEEVVGPSVIEEVEGRLTPQKNDLLFEAEVAYENHSDLKKEIRELIGSFGSDYLKEQFAVKMKELYEAEKSKDKKQVEKLLKECQILTEKLNKLSVKN
jgi:DNA primase